MRTDFLRLEKVRTIPRELSSGVLYVSMEYAVAAHLCACGCGNKVVVPLGPAEWSFSERNGAATLSPSIGNWQLPCRSHYIISGGKVMWAGQWSEAQVLAGRNAEQQRRTTYYAQNQKLPSLWDRFWGWLTSLFRQ